MCRRIENGGGCSGNAEHSNSFIILNVKNQGEVSQSTATVVHKCSKDENLEVNVVENVYPCRPNVNCCFFVFCILRYSWFSFPMFLASALLRVLKFCTFLCFSSFFFLHKHNRKVNQLYQEIYTESRLLCGNSKFIRLHLSANSRKYPKTSANE